MARTRQIYQTDLVYVGPSGNNPATGAHYDGNVSYDADGDITLAGPELKFGPPETNMIQPLFRVQRASWNATKNLTDVNQFGELAAIDRVPLEPPTVQLTFDYLLANLANEHRMGFTVNKAGDTVETSFISGILAGATNPKNYFLKTSAEGSDNIDNDSLVYNVLAIGNGFISSYSIQGSVGSFPTASVTIDALNINGDLFNSTKSGNFIPAVNQVDGSNIEGWWYQLPTGTTSLANAPLTINKGISALRPGDITLQLGLSEGSVGGDTFFDPGDIKVQSFNLSFDLSQEDLNKLGSKYAFAKVPTFPVTTTLQVEAIAGDFSSGKLTEIVNANESYDPSITMFSPGGTTDADKIAKFTVKQAKLDAQASDLSIGQNKTFSMTFNAQIGGPQSLDAGVFASGIVG